MSYQQPLMTSIYRLSLCLLFGCTIWTQGLYASNEQQTPGDHYEQCFGESPRTGQLYLAAVKAGNITEATRLLNVQKKSRTRLSSAEKRSYAYLENNFEEISRWVCTNYLTLSDLYPHILIYIRNFQLPPKLPTNKNKLEELKHSAEDYFNNMMLGIAAAPPAWQNPLLDYIKKEVEQKFQQVQTQIASDPRFLTGVNATIYSQICATVSSIKDNVLEMIDNQRNPTTAGYRKLPNNSATTKLDPNMLVPREQVMDILELCDVSDISAASTKIDQYPEEYFDKPDLGFYFYILDTQHLDALSQIFNRDITKISDCIDAIQKGNKDRMETMFYEVSNPTLEQNEIMKNFRDYFEIMRKRVRIFAAPKYWKELMEWRQNELDTFSTIFAQAKNLDLPQLLAILRSCPLEVLDLYTVTSLVEKLSKANLLGEKYFHDLTLGALAVIAENEHLKSNLVLPGNKINVQLVERVQEELKKHLSSGAEEASDSGTRLFFAINSTIAAASAWVFKDVSINGVRKIDTGPSSTQQHTSNAFHNNNTPAVTSGNNTTQKYTTPPRKPTLPGLSQKTPLSNRKAPWSFSKQALIVGAVSVGFVAGYQLYSRSFAKGKTTATPANLGGMQKKWLFFILFLLLGGLLVGGAFYRKRPPYA